MILYVIFTTHCRLYQHSVLLLFSTHSPISKINATHSTTSSPSHFSLLIGAASIKKRTCSTFFLFFFHFCSFFALETNFLWMILEIYVQCRHRKFYDFFVVILVNGFLCFTELEMHFPFFLKWMSSHHEILHWVTLSKFLLFNRIMLQNFYECVKLITLNYALLMFYEGG